MNNLSLLEAKKEMLRSTFNKKVANREKVERGSAKVAGALKNKKNIAFSGAVGAAGGASAAVLWSKYKKYKKAAEEATSPRDRRIYLAKADRYKKLAKAAGAVGAGVVGAHAATFGGAKAAGAIAKGSREKLQSREASGELTLKEAYADGYYAALKDLDVLAEAYDEYDYYDEY